MTQVSDTFPPVGAILSGPHWPTRVRVVRVEARGTARVLIEAVTLDEQARLIQRVLRREELATLQVVSIADQPTLDGDPLGFRLAAEATRIRLAYTHDPLFAASVARIDPLPHQLEAVYHYMLPQPRLRFLLADDPGAGKTIMAGLLLKELKLRGALTRTLVVAPANLVPQWQREMRSKFDETFDIVDRAALNARDSRGARPERAWEISDQCVVSVDFAWRADVLESLARAQRWDLIIVDEAHKMAAYRQGDKVRRTRRYRLGEVLSEHAEHLLLMTATPHKGDPDNFQLLLQLLDPDLFANTDILARAVQRQENPIFLRRLKEDMKGFDGKPLFPPRYVKTVGVELTDPEQQLYEAVTRYVMENFNRALAEDNRNVTFALIILQRRLASSIRAIRRSLENRRDRLSTLRDEVRANPQLLEAARQGSVGWEELSEDAPEHEIWEAEEQALRYTVARNIDELEAEIAVLDTLARQAQQVEDRGPERKLGELRRVMEQIEVFRTGEKLLIFTEAKDTLDYLMENLTAWGLTVTHIDGSMSPPERYQAEQDFEYTHQVMVATEAAGEGINLQFCHLMINYDLPWNPARLEQRMGRVHRYGQQFEVFVYNLVATSTREGMVFQAMLEKLERMREGLGQDRVFDVVEQLLEGLSLEGLIREALANRLTFEEIRDRVLARLDQDQEQRLQTATLSGLATRYVDLTRLQADRQRSAEARLVPAYIRTFFLQALEALAPGRVERRDDGFWRIPYVPAALRDVPVSLQRRYGIPDDSYAAITFDKADLETASAHGLPVGPTFIGPSHPLFEAVVHHTLARFGPDLAKGAVLRDPAGAIEGLLWLLTGGVEDGLGRVMGKRLFAVFQPLDGEALRHVFPAHLLDFEPPPEPLSTPEAYHQRLTEADAVLDWGLDHVLDPYLRQLQERRQRETGIIRDYLRRSFDVLIARSQSKLMDYEQRALRGTDMGLSIQEEHRHLDDLRQRQATRLTDVERAAVLASSWPEVVGVAGIVHEHAPAVIRGGGEPPMRHDDAVEAAAIARAIAYEQARGWQVEDMQDEDRGYDLVSRSPENTLRYIEVKGRAGVGAVELSANEWLKAEQLGPDYWLYIVTAAVQSPQLYLVQDPAHRLQREDVVPQVRYRVTTEGWGRVAESAEEYRTSTDDTK